MFRKTYMERVSLACNGYCAVGTCDFLRSTRYTSVRLALDGGESP
jgi:hypothetical protein